LFKKENDKAVSLEKFSLVGLEGKGNNDSFF